jgi:hypothetical protein
MANHLNKVEGFASDLESVANRMEHNGVGGDLRQGHVRVLRTMAGCMRADAVAGRIPFRFDDVAHMPSAYAAAPKPQRLSAATVRACAHLGVDVAADKIDLGRLNEALGKSGMNSSQRFQLKTELAACGLID